MDSSDFTYTSIFPICLCGANSDNFTVLPNIQGIQDVRNTSLLFDLVISSILSVRATGMVVDTNIKERKRKEPSACHKTYNL